MEKQAAENLQDSAKDDAYGPFHRGGLARSISLSE
jgi:hypothetical protein